MTNVAFFGGSFNPPHVAHVMAAAYLRGVVGFDQVLVVPVFAHAFDKPLVDYDHRVRMCELSLRFLDGVSVSREEERLSRPSLTLRTLESLSSKHPEWRLRLIIGADVLLDAPKWHAFDRVCAIAPPLVLGRVGVEHEGAPPPILPDVSSTKIRGLLARRGSPEADRELAALVPRPVLDYMDQHGLYR